MTSNEVAVAVKDIHKEFILPQSKNSTFKQTVVNIVKKNKKITNKVLDGVSFEVNKGDFFGIVGRNGSGKSTLLKLIAGVYTPTAGVIEINGGLTPFIELGVGFNPELSGRDNVYLNGALLGFNRRQMDKMYDGIVSFAELGPFMDQKLKNYSSGMQVRLAFSIAIKADNDILMFDEVLAVGDSNFQEKCIRQFNKFKREGRTVILVTHSMNMVEKFCNRVILINAGRIEYNGDSAGAIDRYEALNLENAAKVAEKIKEQTNKKINITSVDILDKNSKEVKIIESGQDYFIRINIDAAEDIGSILSVIRICESENQFPIIRLDNIQDQKDIVITKGHNEISIKITDNPILSGKYYVIVGLYEGPDHGVNYDHYNGMLENDFYLVKSEKDVGVVGVSRKWL